jgi:uncharacterized membrane protein YdjX (TVP38/TMEM64 family)
MNHDSQKPDSATEATSQRWRHGRRISLGLIGVALGGLIALVVFWKDTVDFDLLVARESALLAYRDAHPVTAFWGAFVLYVVVAALSVPGAALLTMICGWLFGTAQGVLLVSFASTVGATIAFLISRYLFRSAVEARLGGRRTAFDRALSRDGAFYLFTLRLIPAVPFFIINVIMGVTSVSVVTFWWASQLGMLPGTCIYVFAGSQFPTMKKLAEQGARGVVSPELIAALLGLAVFPWAARWLVHKLRKRHLAAAARPS